MAVPNVAETSIQSHSKIPPYLCPSLQSSAKGYARITLEPVQCHIKDSLQRQVEALKNHARDTLMLESCHSLARITPESQWRPPEPFSRASCQSHANVTSRCTVPNTTTMWGTIVDKDGLNVQKHLTQHFKNIFYKNKVKMVN